MIRSRTFGSDVPYMAWMRSREKELPSYSSSIGFVATDVDVFVHRYLTVPSDGIGTREVQNMMLIEVKSRSGNPSSSQLDTLSKINLFNGIRRVAGRRVEFFGVFFLKLSGTSPDDSDQMWWGSILSGVVQWQKIDTTTLIALLRFDIHPVTLGLIEYRRHHKTTEIKKLITPQIALLADISPDQARDWQYEDVTYRRS